MSICASPWKHWSCRFFSYKFIFSYPQIPNGKTQTRHYTSWAMGRHKGRWCLRGEDGGQAEIAGIHIHQVLSARLSHPFFGMGPRALALGKIAAFCLELEKNNKTYFVMILVSFNMFKRTCTFIHFCTYSAFRNPRSISRTILLKFVISSHPFFNIFSKSQIGKNWGLNLEKKYYFALGMRPNIGPK